MLSHSGWRYASRSMLWRDVSSPQVLWTALESLWELGGVYLRVFLRTDNLSAATHDLTEQQLAVP